MPKSNAIVFVDKDAGRDATEMDLAPATGTDIIGVDVGDGKVEGRGSGKWIGGFTPAALLGATANNVTGVSSSIVRRCNIAHPTSLRLYRTYLHNLLADIL